MNHLHSNAALAIQHMPKSFAKKFGFPIATRDAAQTIGLGGHSLLANSPDQLVYQQRATAPAAQSPNLAVMPSVKVDTAVGSLAVYDSGEPTPSTHDSVLVLWPSILADHRIYLKQLAAWRLTHRVILIDGPGHGASGPAPGTFTMESCADAQAQILDRLGIVQPIVSIGTSWGGLVGGEFALKYPTRTKGLVMLNTPVYPSERSLSNRMICWGARWMHGLTLFTNGVARAFFLPETRATQPGVLAAFQFHLHQANGNALALSVTSVLLEREDLASRMKMISVPTLFIAGEHDDMYPMEALRKAAASLPKGQFVALPTAHISSVDAPEATTKAIDAFLSML
jgi:3-oxoadipate enol-lactonase